ncbi:60S acidic ribosomal protein P0 [Lemmus lemmus]
MQQIRMSLRGKAVVLMGKNAMMRKANPALEKLLPHIQGNVGFVFTKEDLTEIRDVLLANKVPAVARAGAIAPCEVTVPAQNTGLGPKKTSFFQALGITTKISRGTIEILSDVQLIKTGDKVGASEATLLNMLNISPFSFGLIIQQMFDNGSIHNPEVLDITEQAVHSHFLEGVRNVASVCLQISYPAVASVPHSIINGYKRVLALSVETEYTFPLAEKVKASWLIHLHLWLLPLWLLPPLLLLLLLLLLQPQRRLKPRKSWRNQMKIWDLVSLTNSLKATNSDNLIQETWK